jgi:hypothetical protein
VVVLDGRPSIQKAQTHLRRSKQEDAKVDQFGILVNQLAAMGHESRITKSTWKSLSKKEKSIKTLPVDLRQFIPAVIQVIDAPGEADVYIARFSQPGDVVVSGDSDLLFCQNAFRVARPIRNGCNFIYQVSYFN